MKRNITIALILCLTTVSAFAASNKLEEWMSKFPLEEQTVVIETVGDVQESFNNARTWIIDNLSNGAKNLSSDSNANMITIPIEETYKRGITGVGTLYFTLIIEFKEGRMRWTTRDVKLKLDTKHYVYYSTHDTGYRTGSLGDNFAGCEAYRKEGSALYQKYLEIISEGMQKIASGELAESDW